MLKPGEEWRKTTKETVEEGAGKANLDTTEWIMYYGWIGAEQVVTLDNLSFG